jgi:hypothetical protein
VGRDASSPLPPTRSLLPIDFPGTDKTKTEYGGVIYQSLVASLERKAGLADTNDPVR